MCRQSRFSRLSRHCRDRVSTTALADSIIVLVLSLVSFCLLAYRSSGKLVDQGHRSSVGHFNAMPQHELVPQLSRKRGRNTTVRPTMRGVLKA